MRRKILINSQFLPRSQARLTVGLLKTSCKRCSRLRIVIVATTILTATSCTADDTRTPFETYQACNAAMQTASKNDEAMSCFGSEAQDIMGFQQQDDPNWLESFKASRPAINRLHEAQLLEAADESILMMTAQLAGRPIAASVSMVRERGSWKIAREQLIAKGSAPQDGFPIVVMLRTGDDNNSLRANEMAGSISFKRGPCSILISHLFDYPRIQIPMTCNKLEQTGTYQLDELLDGASEALLLYDHSHTGLSPVSGHLEVTSISGGRRSGEFSFEANKSGIPVAITGSFQNLVYSP